MEITFLSTIYLFHGFLICFSISIGLKVVYEMKHKYSKNKNGQHLTNYLKCNMYINGKSQSSFSG